MVDFVALVTPPILAGPDMKPANGDIYIRSTNTVAKSGLVVVPFQAHGKVVDGTFKSLDGGPLMLVVTPEGVALEIHAELVQDGPNGRRDKYRISRTVSTPNATTVTWDALIDVIPVDAGPDVVIPQWVADTMAARDTATAAATDATAAKASAEAAAASVAPGVANGTATLDAAAKLPESQVPDRLSDTTLTTTISNAVTPKIDKAILPTYVKSFGAVGDGTTNDTAAVQAAINAAGAGGRVVFSKGDYLLGPLTALAHQTLEGVTQFIGTGGSPSTRLKFTGLTAAQVGITGADNNTLRNLLISGPGFGIGTTTGFKTASGSPRFENVGFYHWMFGVHLTGAYYTVFDNCEWSYVQYGVSLNACYNVTFKAPRFNVANPGLTIFGTCIDGAARGLNIFGGSLENYGAAGAITAVNGQAVNLFGVYFESSNSAVASYGINAATRSNVSVAIHGCFIYLTEHSRFVAMSGATNSILASTGNHFVCSAESVATPTAYVLGTAVDATIHGDSWGDVLKGSYIDNSASYLAGGLAGTNVRFPGTYATHGTREYVGRHLVVDATHTIRSGSGLTAARPAANSVLKGSQWYDETLGKPIWSDGAAWKDAAGVTV